MSTFIRWGWWTEGDGCRRETFATPNEAIDHMQKNVGDKTLSEIAAIGFHLVQIQVTHEPILLLRPFKDSP